ncbi:hypothetical protein BWI93_16695, partial [Siphonobacter sp. BAB-5385]
MNFTRQEFLAVEKHIVLLTLLSLKGKQGMKADFGGKNEALEITFNASELKETNRERIKESLERLTTRKIHFDYSKPGHDYFGFIVPIISAKYEGKKGVNSEITVLINPDAKKLFLELSNGYSTLDLQAILSLKSNYSIRLYELLSMKARNEPWTIEVDALKNLLDIELGAYKNFNLFETRILKYTQNELAEHCGVFFDWEVAAKDRKKITALTFTIRDREKLNREFLTEETSKTIDYVTSLGDVQVANKVRSACQKYTLTEKQI